MCSSSVALSLGESVGSTSRNARASPTSKFSSPRHSQPDEFDAGKITACTVSCTDHAPFSTQDRSFEAHHRPKKSKLNRLQALSE